MVGVFRNLCLLVAMDSLTKVIGGGFVMGSPSFNLEYLMALHSMLRKAFKNPAVFAIEYTLVPTTQYPTQPHEVLNGYAQVLHVAKSKDIICLMGDSAGGTLALTLLRDLKTQQAKHLDILDQLPALVILISPWVTLVSDNHQESASDYVSVSRLHQFAQLYAPDKMRGGVLDKASPASMIHHNWKAHTPKFGYIVWQGEDEVLAKDISAMVHHLMELGVPIHVEKRPAGSRSLHVWPIISFFLGGNQERRLEEMRVFAHAITQVMYNAEDS